ncbi:MAG: hypothetical protein KDE27_25555 [Planctomycetes bacterium]|nr:hypothetical protein [Planctomycetota bacterium]
MTISSCWFAVPLFTAAIGAQAEHLVGPGGFPTIQAAVDAASDGDIVRIAPGSYDGFGAQAKSLTFVRDQPNAATPVTIVSGVDLTQTAENRCVLAGLEFRAPNAVGISVFVAHGSVVIENCVFDLAGLVLNGSRAVLRDCDIAGKGTAISLSGADLMANDCRLVGLVGKPLFTAVGAVTAQDSTLQLARCELRGAPGSDPVFRLPTAALAIGGWTAPARVWLVDCTLIGGANATMAEPAIEGGNALVRTHRSVLQHGGGPALPAIEFPLTEQPGPLLTLDVEPALLTIGGNVSLDLRGEPADLLAMLGSFELSAPLPLPALEQPAYGAGEWAVLGFAIGDGTGAATFPLAAPNAPTLRGLVVYLRGIDLARLPLQASPVAGLVVQ